jgi:hypothetical protein
MHITKLLIVACPFLVSCYGGGPRTNTEAVRAKANATSFSIVSGIETLAIRDAHFYQHLVVDSASLVSAARMTAAQIAELRERLLGKVSVGEATVGGACQQRLNAVCWKMRVESFDLEGDSARVRVEWTPVAGCGDSSSTFVLNNQAFVVSEYDRVTGDCVEVPH